MTALSADRSTPSTDIELKGYPMGVDTIYKGALVAINSSGYAVPASDSASDLSIVGVAEESVANESPNAAGDHTIRVRSGRAFRLPATSITQAMVGSMMYAVDDQTIDETTTNGMAVGILVEYISAIEGKVFIPLGGRQPIGGIVNADIAAGAVIARSKLATNTLQAYRVPLANVLGADGADLAITETAGDFYRSIGTNQLLILGEVSNGTVGADVEVSVGWFEFQLPPEYVAGGGVSIQAGVDVVGAGALGTCTIDFEARLQNAITGAVGADLVTTAATAISKTEALKTFTVTPTGLVPGDVLVIKMTTSVDNTDSTAIQAQISALNVLCDIKG